MFGIFKKEKESEVNESKEKIFIEYYPINDIYLIRRVRENEYYDTYLNDNEPAKWDDKQRAAQFSTKNEAKLALDKFDEWYNCKGVKIIDIK